MRQKEADKQRKSPGQKAESMAEEREDINEVDAAKIVTRIQAVLAGEYSDFLKYLNVLRQYGIVDRIIKVVNANPYDRKKYERMTDKNDEPLDNLDKRKEYILHLIGEICPKNFLQSINHTLREISEHKKAKIPPNESNQGLYHLVDDKRLLSIIKEGFKGLDEHKKGAKSTGELERLLGLSGIFFSYGNEYPWNAKTGESNLVVFPANLAYEDDSVCIAGELSYEMCFGDGAWDFEKILELLNLQDIYFEDPKNLRKEDFIMFILSGMVAALDRIIGPDQLDLTMAGRSASDFYEVCVNPVKLELPQMIIVEEEPEYFYEEAAAAKTQFVNVPVISDENVSKALKKAGIEVDDEFSNRSKFVELVNMGKIDPTEWAVNK